MLHRSLHFQVQGLAGRWYKRVHTVENFHLYVVGAHKHSSDTFLLVGRPLLPSIRRYCFFNAHLAGRNSYNVTYCWLLSRCKIKCFYR